MRSVPLAGLFVLSGQVFAAPLANQAITAISAAQVTAYRPYTFFASAGYCVANAALSWSCGGSCVFLFFNHTAVDYVAANCLANPDFQPIASGGDGEFIQYCEYTQSTVSDFRYNYRRVCGIFAVTQGAHFPHFQRKPSQSPRRGLSYLTKERALTPCMFPQSHLSSRRRLRVDSNRIAWPCSRTRRSCKPPSILPCFPV
jgi:hypothetical protein